MFVVVLVLGWNELISILTNPVLLLMVLFGLGALIVVRIFIPPCRLSQHLIESALFRTSNAMLVKA
jgi:hypothetical protein